MDWTGCDVIERVPGKVGGRPVVKGTLIEPDVILIDEEFGRTPEQTRADFPTLSVDAILKIRAFAHKHQFDSVKVLLDENLPHSLREHLFSTRRSLPSTWEGPV
jgi:uncharacterized protein (DUF433 family)